MCDNFSCKFSYVRYVDKKPLSYCYFSNVLVESQCYLCDHYSCSACRSSSGSCSDSDAAYLYFSEVVAHGSQQL